ncbi:phytanoyl-CoA dioxygenase family protein [Chloroflexi bacterium TSY]|nr:phytanoyl-CoA dioxygenase family protein [Chloroflexi bacterium TSY]
MTTRSITLKQVQQFQQEGYCILESVLSPEQLTALRDETAQVINRTHQKMDEEGVEKIGFSVRDRRYVVQNSRLEQPGLKKFIFSALMAEITQALLGPNVYLFNEQFVIKCADPILDISWHQDSGYVHPDHKPYLSCWIPLDDVTEENGTVYLLPFSRTGIRTWVKHERDPVKGEGVGYFGNDPGILVEVPAGSVVCMSSVVFHASGPNKTDQLRRVYLVQYSSEVITQADGNGLFNQADPFIKAGVLVNLN